ncbi:uncharacterized protein JCM10292_005819 [Rhodotorula paludigena]|uniref:uncharacterized protein n=1 Tax=Rhodotorula paludigena TaxID=86838 RepID=UPI00317B2356
MQGMYSSTHTGQTGAIDNMWRLAVALRQRGVRSRPGYVQPSRVIEIIDAHRDELLQSYLKVSPSSTLSDLMEKFRALALALHVPHYEHRRPEIARALLGIMDVIEQRAHAHIEHLDDPNSLAWHERLFKSPENRHHEAEAIQRVMDGFPATRKDLEKVNAVCRGGLPHDPAKLEELSTSNAALEHASEIYEVEQQYVKSSGFTELEQVRKRAQHLVDNGHGKKRLEPILEAIERCFEKEADELLKGPFPDTEESMIALKNRLDVFYPAHPMDGRWDHAVTRRSFELLNHLLPKLEAVVAHAEAQATQLRRQRPVQANKIQQIDTYARNGRALLEQTKGAREQLKRALDAQAEGGEHALRSLAHPHLGYRAALRYHGAGY